MIGFPYEVNALLQEIEARIGAVRILYEPDTDPEILGLVDQLQRLPIRLAANDGSGEAWFNERREFFGGWVQTFLQTIPQPEEPILSRGRPIAVGWRVVNAMARRAERLDVGDNAWYREALGMLYQLAWQLSLFENHSEGVSEIPVG